MSKHSEPPRKVGQYCLKCFADLASSVESCNHCGHKVRATERRVYWNLHPATLRVQRLAWVAAMVIGALLSVLVVFELPFASMASLRFGRASIALVLSGWFLLAALLQSVSLLTRHEASRMQLPWPLLGTGFGVLGYFVGGWPLAVPLLAITPLSWWVRGRFIAWKAGLIEGKSLQPSSEVRSASAP